MEDLTELRQRLRTQRPVPWEQLPDFALYMDQVLSYMDRQVIRFDEDDGLTSAMVNNYTKSGLVPPGRRQEVQPGAPGLPHRHLCAQAGDVHPGHGPAHQAGTAGRTVRGPMATPPSARVWSRPSTSPPTRWSSIWTSPPLRTPPSTSPCSAMPQA